MRFSNFGISGFPDFSGGWSLVLGAFKSAGGLFALGKISGPHQSDAPEKKLFMSKALKAAIEANDPAATSKALKTVKDLSRKLPKGEAPLAHACKVGSDAVIDVLLEAGAPLRGKSDFEGNHP